MCLTAGRRFTKEVYVYLYALRHWQLSFRSQYPTLPMQSKEEINLTVPLYQEPLLNEFSENIRLGIFM